MTDETPAASEPFNLDQLKELIELMEKHGLTEVHLRRGAEQWRLRRGGHEVAQMIPVQAAAPAPVMAPTPAAEAAAAPASNLHEIKSPTVWTFYLAASPEDSPFVSIGSSVQPDTVVCLIEAMKVFEQITADCSGTITEILIQNGDMVDHNKPLFRVKPA
jgi:acetyl-CoA carboxylase biotin carboxyl carrier protein